MIPPPVEVTQTPAQLAESYAEAGRRYAAGCAGKRGPDRMADVRGGRRSLEVERASTAAEHTCAIARNEPWLPSPDPDPEGDLGPGLFVKWTAYDGGCLVLQPSALDDGAYALVTGWPPTQIIRGWLFGCEVKLARHWRRDVPHPAYFAPQDTPLRVFRDRRLEAAGEPELRHANGRPVGRIVGLEQLTIDLWRARA